MIIIILKIISANGATTSDDAIDVAEVLVIELSESFSGKKPEKVENTVTKEKEEVKVQEEEKAK